MNHFTNDEMADMHLAYGEARGNSREAARIYADRFPTRRVPDSRTFTAIHRRLRETGSLRPIQHDREGNGWSLNVNRKLSTTSTNIQMLVAVLWLMPLGLRDICVSVACFKKGKPTSITLPDSSRIDSNRSQSSSSIFKVDAKPCT